MEHIIEQIKQIIGVTQVEKLTLNEKNIIIVCIEETISKITYEAVQCNSKLQWDWLLSRSVSKVNSKFRYNMKTKYNMKTIPNGDYLKDCINITFPNYKIGSSRHYRKKDFTIISFRDYIQREGLTDDYCETMY